MSYEILYNKQFVKLPDNKIIPLVLGGSNNCYEAKTYRGKEKRSREWFVHSYYCNKGNRYFENADTYLKNIELMRDKEVAKVTGPDYWDKNANYTADSVNKTYGYFIGCKIYGQGSCGSMSFNSYYNFYKNGVKTAKTIEELKEIGITLHFTVYNWYKVVSRNMPEPTFNPIQNTEDFFNQVKIAEDYETNCILIDNEGKEHKPHVSLSYIASYEYVEQKIKKFNIKKEKKEKKPVELNVYYALKNDSGFLVRYTSRGFKYSYYPSWSTKKFVSDVSAEKYRQNLIKKNKHLAQDWKVTPIEGKVTLYV